MIAPALAFYKGRGNWLDRLIRLATRSRYSHVEYVPDYSRTEACGSTVCWSSSPRDGGVRRAEIDLADGKWDVVPLSFLHDDRQCIFENLAGARYDTFGILFSQFFSLRRHSSSRWFCSEICAFAIALPAPETFSPGTLLLAVKTLNQVYRSGLDRGLHAALPRPAAPSHTVRLGP